MKQYKKYMAYLPLLVLVILVTCCKKEDKKEVAIAKNEALTVYSAPKSEKPFEDYKITVDGSDVFCYSGKVFDTRFTEGTLMGESEIKYSTVGFGYFDISGKVKVSVKVNREISSATIRPLSRNIEATVKNNTIEFYVDKPGALTIEPDGNEHKVLHLFVNPKEENVPSPDDENVIYFGPGEHVVNTIKLKSNQTLYVAGGAVVYFDVFEGDSIYRKEYRKRRQIELDRYDHGIEAINAKNIKIKGRGILDFNRVLEKMGRKNPIHTNNCDGVEIEGVIMRGANCWHATIYRSKNVVIDNIKEIGAGYNTDGLNIVLSQNVHIKNCFLRQRDDGIVMKSMDTGNMDAFIVEVPQERTSTSNVLVEDCTIWSDWGYALGITYETRMPVNDITFRNCDIIHATHAETAQGVIGILVADADVVSNVKFENITIERALKPIIKLDQRVTPWTVNKDLGAIKDITFSNIKYLSGEPQPVIFHGFPGKGGIQDIKLKNLNFLGKDIKSTDDWEFKINKYVKDIHFE
ncbi:glycosyl hydrolase family 28 protein [uncultured Algibacter sp.]|uniref:glycosyl hydrolase family 28 protein n=1 Tax=uncultured Algibacter sp. TaxID=298659 RepID=UPI00261D8043|nr:glycosyl hydrolase family 28 protein [uncultured Algibacter sp.]